MRIFDRVDPWASKVNFVDENNVMLGYDMRQACCEYAGWFIADKRHEQIPTSIEAPAELPGWNFDPEWFERGTIEFTEEHESRGTGALCLFRIVKGDAEQFIHLFNCHNGFYAHGFEFKTDEAVLQTGQL